MVITKDEVVTVCAIGGAALGIINLVRSLYAASERVRIRVRLGGGGQIHGIEIVNNSVFPVTVVKVGSVDRGNRVSDVALEIFNAKADSLPARVDARSSRLLRVSRREAALQQGLEPRFYFATTALGRLHTSERWPRRRARRLLELVRARKKML